MGKLIRFGTSIYLMILGYVIFADAISTLKNYNQLEMQVLIALNIVYLLMSVGIFYGAYTLIKNLRNKFNQILWILIMFFFFYEGQLVIWSRLIQDPTQELIKNLVTWLIIYLIPIIMIFINLKIELGKSSKK